MNVPFFDYPHIYERNKEELLKIFDEVCSRGAFILQRDLEEFETSLAEFLNAKYAIGLADGTNAISLGLRSRGIGEGDEIIIASHTYIATAAAIREVGGTPVFADIDDDFMLCPKSAEEQITEKTKAIMVTQLNGRCCDMEKFAKICSEKNIDLYEDSAQGLGASYRGKNAATFGKFGTISFYPAKVLGCFGDGGALVTNDDDVADFVSLYRDHGRDQQGKVIAWGSNCRLDNLQAAFLNFRLKNYSEDMTRRRAIATKYCDGLKDIEEVYLPPSPDSDTHFDVYQNFEVAFERREELKSYLLEKGIRAIPQWNGTPVHHFEKLGYGKQKFSHLPKTDWFFDRCLMLPMNMSISDEQVNYVVRSISDFYSKT